MKLKAAVPSDDNLDAAVEAMQQMWKLLRGLLAQGTAAMSFDPTVLAAGVAVVTSAVVAAVLWSRGYDASAIVISVTGAIDFVLFRMYRQTVKGE